MSIERLREIVNLAVPTLFAQIHGGRIPCESEATLQLHLGRVISTVADLVIVSPGETFTIELEKPLPGVASKRGRIDIWFCLTSGDGNRSRCALELKFFKKINQREPNNRYDVFRDIARLERCQDIADVAFMLVATDHAHYVTQAAYSDETSDFDLRDGRSYKAGSTLTYRTGRYGGPITLARDYEFKWAGATARFRYLLLEITPGHR